MNRHECPRARRCDASGKKGVETIKVYSRNITFDLQTIGIYIQTITAGVETMAIYLEAIVFHVR
jgi:hypothetical protein